MGYCTHYELTIIPESAAIRVVIENKDQIYYAICDDAGSYKWYDHEQDMRDLSARFPDHIFELCGEGEDAGDIWRKYFKNGKMQKCHAQITFEPFDESKLS